MAKLLSSPIDTIAYYYKVCMRACAKTRAVCVIACYDTVVRIVSQWCRVTFIKR
jgi:hypothetical protein